MSDNNHRNNIAFSSPVPNADDRRVEIMGGSSSAFVMPAIVPRLKPRVSFIVEDVPANERLFIPDLLAMDCDGDDDGEGPKNNHHSLRPRLSPPLSTSFAAVVHQNEEPCTPPTAWRQLEEWTLHCLSSESLGSETASSDGSILTRDAQGVCCDADCDFDQVLEDSSLLADLEVMDIGGGEDCGEVNDMNIKADFWESARDVRDIDFYQPQAENWM